MKRDPSLTSFPTPINPTTLSLPKEKKIELMKAKMAEMLEIVGLNTSDPTLSSTAEKYATMMVEEMFSSLDPKTFPHISYETVDFAKNETVILKNITLLSWCEHHLVPMSGLAHIAYIPKNRIIGLSKINEVVRYFARRPQLQERLTSQIAESLSIILETDDIAVVTHLKHYCIAARGVEDAQTRAQMHVLKGKFETDPLKHFEFFSSLK